MIEIKVNDEIRDVSAEFFMGLNIRQTLWSGLGVLIGAITGMFCYFKLNMPITMLVYVSTIPVVPFAFIAFYNYHGLTFLEVIKILISIVRTKSIKKYDCANLEYMKFKEKKKKGDRKHGFKNTKKSCSR